MGWLDRFRRDGDQGREVPTSAGAAPGPLGPDDVARVTAMAQQAFADAGREVVPDGQGGLRAVDGQYYGLANLIATLGQVPREHWPAVVQQHATIMDGAMAATPLTLDSVRDRLYLRLRPENVLPKPLEYPSPALPGLVGMLAIDHPDHVEELSGLGGLGDWEEIRQIALDNIRRLPAMVHEPVATNPERSDATVHLFSTDDFFGPSRYFALDQLVERTGVQSSAPDLLLVVPNRHIIAFHEITGPGVAAAMNGLVNLGFGQYRDKPGALVPHVYYVGADGQSQQVTWPEDGTVTVRLMGPVEEAFKRHGALPA